MSRMKLLLDVVEDMRSLADSLQALADVVAQPDESPAEPKTVPSPTPASSPITLEEVRAVLAEKSHDGLTAEVRELLQRYGANKLSAVDPSHYADLLRDAEVLGHAT